MSKTIIAFIVFALIVLGAWFGAQYIIPKEAATPPEFSQAILEPLDITIEQSYLNDLQARADNRIGIELEL